MPSGIRAIDEKRYEESDLVCLPRKPNRHLLCSRHGIGTSKNTTALSSRAICSAHEGSMIFVAGGTVIEWYEEVEAADKNIVWEDFDVIPAHYQKLGVAPGVTPEEIKRAYRTKAKKCHPDSRPPHEKTLAAQEMQSLNEAYSILGSTSRRAVYDRFHGIVVADVG